MQVKQIYEAYKNISNQKNLFSKADDYYENFEVSETIEQTSEELSYASFPCEHCEYVATHGHNLKNILKQSIQELRIHVTYVHIKQHRNKI